MYMYMYMYMYILICIYLHMYIYIYIYTHIAHGRNIPKSHATHIKSHTTHMNGSHQVQKIHVTHYAHAYVMAHVTHMDKP